MTTTVDIEPCRRSLERVDLAGFLAHELPEPEYVIKPLIPRGHVTLLGAHGGAGKSLLAETIAAHVAAGATWEGNPTTSGRAVYLSLEDDAAMMKRRLRRIVNAFALDAERVTERLVILDGTKGDGALASETFIDRIRMFEENAAMKELRTAAIGAALIVVDNASDAYDGNENDRRTVRQFIRMLAKIARDNDAAVLLLAHIDKAAARNGAAGNSYSGSTAWHNSCRSRLTLAVDEEGVVRLRHEKHNLGPLAAPMALRWDEHGLLVLAESRSASGSNDQVHADADAVLDALRAAQAAGVNVPSARNGPVTARHALASCGLPLALSEKNGNRRFWSAIDFLLAEKCANRENYINGQRKEKERIVAVQGAPIECANISPNTPSAIGAPGGRALRQSAPKAIGARLAQIGAADEYRRAKDGE